MVWDELYMDDSALSPGFETRANHPLYISRGVQIRMNFRAFQGFLPS